MSNPGDYAFPHKEERCEKHGIVFDKWLYAPGTWFGACAACEEELKFKQEADRELEPREAEIREKALKLMQDPARQSELESEIERTLKEELEAAAAKWKPQIRNQLRSDLFLSLKSQIEGEMRAEIIARLKNPEPVAADRGE